MIKVGMVSVPIEIINDAKKKVSDHYKKKTGKDISKDELDFSLSEIVKRDFGYVSFMKTSTCWYFV